MGPQETTEILYLNRIKRKLGIVPNPHKRKRVLYVPVTKKKYDFDKQSPKKLKAEEVCFLCKDWQFYKEYFFKGDFLTRNVSIPPRLKGDFAHDLIYYQAMNESGEFNDIRMTLNHQDEMEQKTEKILNNLSHWNEDSHRDFVLHRLFERRFLVELVRNMDIYKAGTSNTITAARPNFKFNLLSLVFWHKFLRVAFLASIMAIDLLLFPYVLVCLCLTKNSEYKGVKKKLSRGLSMSFKTMRTLWSVMNRRPSARFILRDEAKKCIKIENGFSSMLKSVITSGPFVISLSSLFNLGIVYLRMPIIYFLPRLNKQLMRLGLYNYYNLDTFGSRYWNHIYYPFLKSEFRPIYILDNPFKKDLLEKLTRKPITLSNMGSIVNVKKENFVKKINKPKSYFAFADQYYFLPISLRLKVVKDLEYHFYR